MVREEGVRYAASRVGCGAEETVEQRRIMPASTGRLPLPRLRVPLMQ